MRAVLALDIGGANLKVAHSRGVVRLEPYELWKSPAGLTSALRGILQELPPFDLLAVTMTGELCDCFETKRHGVNAILDAVEAIAGDAAVRVWQTDGRLVNVAVARAAPLQTAAANWLALATFAGRLAPQGPALVLDIGSTTTDITPLCDGKPLPTGRTDLERLHSQELIYTGARRTPLCALLGAAGAAELFATTLDAYLLLGWLPENAADRNTADGRPATRAAAHARLARMFCADSESFTEMQAWQLASRIHQEQSRLIRGAVEAVSQRLPGPPRTVVLAGSGEFLARSILVLSPILSAARLVSIGETCGPMGSAAACAYALAVLAAEQDRGG